MLTPRNNIAPLSVPWAAGTILDLGDKTIRWTPELRLICRAFETANFTLATGRCASARNSTAQSRTRGRRRKDAPDDPPGTHKDWMHDEAYMEAIEWYYYDQRSPGTPYCLEWCLEQLKAAGMDVPDVKAIRANFMPIRRTHRRVEQRITDELTHRSVRTLLPLEVLRIQSAWNRGETIKSIAKRFNVGECRVRTAIRG